MGNSQNEQKQQGNKAPWAITKEQQAMETKLQRLEMLSLLDTGYNTTILTMHNKWRLKYLWEQKLCKMI